MIRARGLALVGACFALLAAYPGGGAGSVPATSVSRPAPSTGRITSTASRAAATIPTRTAAPATAFEAATTHAVTTRHSKNQTIDLQRRNGPLDVAPAVTGVSPKVGPSSGGTPIAIDGSGFTGTTDVFFGTTDVSAGTSCPNSNGCIASVSDGEIDAQTPPESAGPLDITVENDVDTSPVNAPADQFTWLDPPTVTNVDSPQNEGATGIAVTGNNFSVPGVGGDAVTNVELDPTGAGSTVNLPACGSTGCFTFVDDNDLTINLPASVPPGQYDVRVTTPGGTSNQSSNDFLVVQQADPTVTSVTPDAGPTAGGTTSIAIVGTNFEGSGFGATDVFFGGSDVSTPCPNAAGCFTVNSATSITATSPSGTGQEHVTVQTQSTDGTAVQTSNTSPADTFVYAPVPTLGTPSPASGPTLGGNNVTLNGTGFELNQRNGRRLHHDARVCGGDEYHQHPVSRITRRGVLHDQQRDTDRRQRLSSARRLAGHCHGDDGRRHVRARHTRTSRCRLFRHLAVVRPRRGRESRECQWHRFHGRHRRVRRWERHPQ